MTKELEALNYVWYNYYTEELSRNEVEQIEKHLNIVQDGLKRLEQIDNAKPSEALECLEWVIKNYIGNDYYVYEEELDTIKQYILKAQEQEKVLKILREKRVDLPYLRCCFEDNQSVCRYNEYIRNKTMDYDHEQELTEEEFDLVKRYCDKKGKGE